jgi:DNA invertase Pin-like site-specific DNA recombinase
MKNDNTKVKAIALCRVSTVKQGIEGSSLEAQETRVYDAAALFNAEIVRFWSITRSSRKGKNYQRKDLMEMLAFAKSDKKVKYIIVDEPDRFMRDLETYYYWKVKFRQEADTKLVYAKKPHLANDDSMVSTMEEMIDVFRGEASNVERIMKTTSNMQARVAAGYYPSNPKAGYQRTDVRGLHSPKEPEWSMLRSGFLQVLEGLPIKDVVAGINAAGYKRKSGRGLDAGHFKVMLKDPFYAGIIQMSSWTVNPRGLHKAMITPEQHESLKPIAKGAVPRQRKQFNPDFPLSKIMTCKECVEAGAEHPLLVGYDHNNGKVGDKRKYYKRYRCRACNNNVLRSDLHEQLSDTLLDLKLSEPRTKDFLAALRQVWQQEQALSYNTAESLKNRLSTLEHEKKEVILRQVRGQLADDRADIAIDALDEEINAVKEQVESIATIEKDFVEFVEFSINTVEGFREKFWELDQEHQRWCKQLLFPDGFSVSRDKKVYTPKISEFYRVNKNAPKDVSADYSRMVTPAGFEPAIFWMRTRYPKPLDEGA